MKSALTVSRIVDAIARPANGSVPSRPTIAVSTSRYSGSMASVPRAVMPSAMMRRSIGLSLTPPSSHTRSWRRPSIRTRRCVHHNGPMFDLSGKTALVTGAGQSVGAGIARALAGQGATVWVNDIVGARAHDVARSIQGNGGDASAISFDVTDASAVDDAFGRVGSVDILVNNAGNAGADTFTLKQFHEMDAAEYSKFLDVNLFGVLHCTRAALGRMYERRWGRIITIASGAGTTGSKIGISVYGAAKGGSIAFMRHIAMEAARHGVTANTIALGLMENPTRSAATDQMAKGVPVGRLGTPDDAGATCVWLASDEASWMTGKTISLDGGAGAP